MEFWTSAADSQWNKAVLRAQLKDELAACDDPNNLQALVSLTARMDKWLCERHPEKASCFPNPLSSNCSGSPWTAQPAQTIVLLRHVLRANAAGKSQINNKTTAPQTPLVLAQSA